MFDWLITPHAACTQHPPHAAGHPLAACCAAPVPGAAGFEASLGELIKGGADLSSRQLRQLMAPAATAGLGAVAGRSLQVRGVVWSMKPALSQLPGRAWFSIAFSC